MKKVMIGKEVHELITKKVEAFETVDGRTFIKKENAEEHEKLIKEFTKLSESAFEWLYGIDITETYEDALEAFRSDKVILLCSHSGGDGLFFEAIEPSLAGVKAVIKVLHRRTVGCNCNQYVDEVVYKGESFCFDDNKKEDGTYYTTGHGRNIKEVLS